MTCTLWYPCNPSVFPPIWALKLESFPLSSSKTRISLLQLHSKLLRNLTSIFIAVFTPKWVESQWGKKLKSLSLSLIAHWDGWEIENPLELYCCCWLQWKVRSTPTKCYWKISWGSYPFMARYESVCMSTSIQEVVSKTRTVKSYSVHACYTGSVEHVHQYSHPVNYMLH